VRAGRCAAASGCSDTSRCCIATSRAARTSSTTRACTGWRPDVVDELLDRVGMHGRAEDPVRSLSRGMVQRLTIARAVLHAPELLLLDEPRSNLDPAAASWSNR